MPSKVAVARGIQKAEDVLGWLFIGGFGIAGAWAIISGYVWLWQNDTTAFWFFTAIALLFIVVPLCIKTHNWSVKQIAQAARDEEAARAREYVDKYGVEPVQSFVGHLRNSSGFIVGDQMKYDFSPPTGWVDRD